MKQLFALGLLPCVFLGSCASIVSKSKYPVAITSSPSGAKFTVKNGEGTVVQQGTTPSTVTLPASSGYFKAASYTVEFTKKGSAKQSIEVNARIDGWYYGNILIGGVIGMVVVDPLTGAMWRLDDKVDVILPSLTALKTDHGGNLRIVDRASVPGEMEKHLMALR
ncbi:MAG: hypothetical protein ABIS50_02940 [Luteolibacter sp.]|uniref:hypothetical protein n=1 Tax=Luteolibacter sp. TaxID=1962973 RepID=UPI00326530EF